MLIRALAASLLLVAVTFTYAAAQEPTPEPTPEWPRCLGDAGSPGGRAIDVANGIQVTIPAGHYQQVVMPPHSDVFALCHLETGALVTISIETCREVSRRAATPEANAVVDQIVSSCKLPPARPSEPYCPAGTAVTGGRDLTIDERLRVTLPDATFVISYDDRRPGTVTVCKVLANGLSMDYSVTLSFTDCNKVSAATLTDFALADRLAASCVLLESGSGTPAGSGIIRPPDTGNAGLLITDWITET